VAFPDGSHCGYLLGAQALACFKRESGVSASVFNLCLLDCFTGSPAGVGAYYAAQLWLSKVLFC
jgi:hypothetical protein